MVSIQRSLIRHGSETRSQTREGSVATATEVKIRDNGDWKDALLCEANAKDGAPDNGDPPRVPLESNTPSMEVPAPPGGKVEKLLIHLGDKAGGGSPILLLRSGDAALPPP